MEANEDGNRRLEMLVSYALARDSTRQFNTCSVYKLISPALPLSFLRCDVFVSLGLWLSFIVVVFGLWSVWANLASESDWLIIGLVGGGSA